MAARRSCPGSSRFGRSSITVRRRKKARRCRSRTIRLRRACGGKGAHLRNRRWATGLPLKGLDIQIVSARGKTLSEPLPGGGQDNPACSAFKKKANDFTENARSFGFRLVYGKFTLPRPRRSGLERARSAGVPDQHARQGRRLPDGPSWQRLLRRARGDGGRAAARGDLWNNGETKGGDAKTFTTLQGLPGLEDLWQLHLSANKGAKQADEAFIANLSEDTAYRITLSASEDGSFALANARTALPNGTPRSNVTRRWT